MDTTESICRQARQELLSEYNRLNREIQDGTTKLARMEAHDGADGTKEDVDGQCDLEDSIADKRRRVAKIRSIIYPKR